ncbi:MAG: hypothetical protein AB1567_04620 [bacterium]
MSVVTYVTVKPTGTIIIPSNILKQAGFIPKEKATVELLKEKVIVKKKEPTKLHNKSFKVEQLTIDYITNKIKRKGSIDDIQIDSSKVEKAILQVYGTNDPIELIKMVRR